MIKSPAFIAKNRSQFSIMIQIVVSHASQYNSITQHLKNVKQGHQFMFVAIKIDF